MKKLDWKYVESKYEVLYDSDAAYNQKILRLGEDISDKTMPVSNNFTCDLIRELIAAKEEIARLTLEKKMKPKRNDFKIFRRNERYEVYASIGAYVDIYDFDKDPSPERDESLGDILEAAKKDPSLDLVYG